MTCERGLFCEFNPDTGGQTVRVATDEKVPAEGVGTILLNVRMDNGQVARMRLGNVLYVPKLRMSLLSVAQAANQGTRFDFHTNPGSVVLANDFFKVTCASEPSGLYILHSARSTPAALAVRPDLTLDLMHRRFGHASKATISKMAKKNSVTGLDVKPDTENIPCDACELGTKRRASFKMTERAGMDGPNIVVHSDIAGPVEYQTLQLERYVLLFVDGFSRYCTVRLLKHRSEFFRCFLDYKAAAETKHNRAIHRFISDNGGEYLSDQFQDYCRENGIEHDTTVAYTPEQNGMAEVRFRVLFNKVRTVLIAGNAPKQLWGEAILAMVYTYNRTIAAGTGVTPFELWHGHRPDVSNLREFGSLAYVYLPTKMHPKARSGQKRQKLDYKSMRGIFVGYAEHQKGWKILDCQRGAIITSCHVTFDESKSAAAQELVRQELRELGARTALDFDYYTRTATSEVDLLFFNQCPAEQKPTANDIVLLEEFISDFDLASVNTATTWPLLASYAPTSAPWLRTLIGPQALTTLPVNPILHATRKQKQAEVLVALENITHKENLGELARYGMGVDPQTYRDAMACPDAAEWRQAIAAEGKAIRENRTWTLVELPTGKRALSCRWLFKKKYHSDGSLERYKARLVVIGCQQIKYVDFDDVFAPVVRLESLRVLLAIVCIENLECDQMDIETAFLNGILNEEVYMKQPEGMVDAGKEGLVCKLLKSLYGLKQAPRAWHKALTDFLEKEGFERLQCEACIYVRVTNKGRAIVAIYVDDLLIIAKSVDEVSDVKSSIGRAFKTKDMGPVSYILGIRVTRDRTSRKLWLNQELNAAKIVDRFNLNHAHEVHIPSVPGKKLIKPPLNETGDMMAEMAAKPFRQAVGSLMYLMIGTRPDLAYAIQDVSRFLNGYGKPHWEAVKQVIKYVKKTSTHGLEFSGTEVKLKAFTDSDYAADEEERKSVSGYVTFVGECAVTWSSRKQRIVAQSTAEAEYIALAHCTREVLFLRQLLLELGYEQNETTIYEDNQACIAIAENPSQHSRTKHIDVRYHFVREHVRCKNIVLEYVASRENIADTFTKALARDHFVELKTRLQIGEAVTESKQAEEGVTEVGEAEHKSRVQRNSSKRRRLSTSRSKTDDRPQEGKNSDDE